MEKLKNILEVAIRNQFSIEVLGLLENIAFFKPHNNGSFHFKCEIWTAEEIISLCVRENAREIVLREAGVCRRYNL